jgi:hypothetical protein
VRCQLVQVGGWQRHQVEAHLARRVLEMLESEQELLCF